MGAKVSEEKTVIEWLWLSDKPRTLHLHKALLLDAYMVYTLVGFAQLSKTPDRSVKYYNILKKEINFVTRIWGQFDLLMNFLQEGCSARLDLYETHYKLLSSGTRKKYIKPQEPPNRKGEEHV